MTPPVSIRIAEPTDVPQLATLFKATVLQHGSQYYTAQQTAAWAAAADDRARFQQFILSVTTYLAVNESNILGFAGISSDGYVASAYIHHQYLGQGIGSALMAQILDHAERDCLPRLYCEASKFSVGLFIKFGFRLYATEVVERHGVSFERYLMEKLMVRKKADADCP
ncbi:MAG: GNAT family N-acetyltransferase [Cyanobacteria bacterium J06607_6]